MTPRSILNSTEVDSETPAPFALAVPCESCRSAAPDAYLCQMACMRHGPVCTCAAAQVVAYICDGAAMFAVTEVLGRCADAGDLWAACDSLRTHLAADDTQAAGAAGFPGALPRVLST